MKKKVFALITICVILCTAQLCAQETTMKDVFHYTLDNGLELFIAENNLVPLTYIEVAVKGGGIGQDEDSVGLFHLYEHMIFKGNSKFKDAASVQKAINDMGVPQWNGTTGNEYVNYFFTVPSDLTYDGLEFWSYAIREPLLDEQEFENEKEVVIAELEGRYADPGMQLNSALYKYAFPETPWKFDPGGDIENVKNATLDALIDMKNTYYIPNNTALFVGGDVQHEEVFKMVKEIYGDWEKGADPWANNDYMVANESFEEPIYLVQANPQISPELAQVQVMFRGPDAGSDLESTYAADVFSNLASNPNSNFVRAIVGQQELGIPSSDYLGTICPTTKHGSFIQFISIMVSPTQNINVRAGVFARLLQLVISDKIISNTIADMPFFTQDEYDFGAQRLKDQILIGCQTAEGVLGGLRNAWASATEDYFFNYQENIEATTQEDVAEFFTKYIKEKNPIVLVIVNPQVYDLLANDFEASGYTLITPENAFWWN